MTPEEKEKQAEKARKDHVQTLINEQDRPRLRAIEVQRKADASYYSAQPEQPPGVWRVPGSKPEPPEAFVPATRLPAAMLARETPEEMEKN